MSAKTGVAARYSLTTPCVRCPFRTDVRPFLRPGRAQDIAKSLRGGGEFTCHKTVVLEVDEETGEEDLVDDLATSKVCAGSVIVMLKDGSPNQMARIAMNLGLLDPDALNMDAPVHDSLSAWVASYRSPTKMATSTFAGVTDTAPYEHCGVVGPECWDPPGYVDGGGAHRSDDEPTCDPFDSCENCGAAACEECRAEWTEHGFRCINCVGDDDDEG